MKGHITETNYNDKLVKDICYNCGSKTAKQSYNFFNRLAHVSGDKVWDKVLCKVWSKDNLPFAFYYATKCKTHVRLIEIAVKKDYQGQGWGRKILTRLLNEMKTAKIDTLTFRSPIKEEAPDFWLHMGAKIIGVKGDDYEMELKIKI